MARKIDYGSLVTYRDRSKIVDGGVVCRNIRERDRYGNAIYTDLKNGAIVKQRILLIR